MGGRHHDNEGYGSKLETIVMITLSPFETGTRMRLIQPGFLPRNKVAYQNMSDGWTVVVKRLEQVVAEDNDVPAHD